MKKPALSLITGAFILSLCGCDRTAYVPEKVNDEEVNYVASAVATHGGSTTYIDVNICDPQKQLCANINTLSEKVKGSISPCEQADVCLPKLQIVADHDKLRAYIIYNKSATEVNIVNAGQGAINIINKLSTKQITIPVRLAQ